MHNPAPATGPGPGPGPGPVPVAAAAARRTTQRAFSCRCGRPLFFRNSVCLACGTPLGYEPESGALLALQPAAAPGLWLTDDGSGQALAYRRCANLDTAAACNWLIADTDVQTGPSAQCRCCRLTRTLPDLSNAENAQWWRGIELARRRLVSSLIGLRLPVLSKVEDPARGLAFDLLRALPGGPPVVTGHDDGVITLDVQEADDSTRELRRSALREPYRTLLGHLRHECGHYYWQRLVDGSEWVAPYRALFGDERQDYPGALQRHYQAGPPADWGTQYVSAYASSHPWEDWAETWAHYMHMVDTLDTALSFGVDGERVELNYERYGPAELGLESSLDTARQDDGADFFALLNGWMELTGVLNEMSRSMGMPDFYPFVLSRSAVVKLLFVHRVVKAADPGAAGMATTA